MIQQFPSVELRSLTSVQEATSALAALKSEGKVLNLGVGCIPSVEPQTEGEKMVYDVVEAIFRQKTLESNPSSSDGNYIGVPSTPIFFDMAYKVSVRRSGYERY